MVITANDWFKPNFDAVGIGRAHFNGDDMTLEGNAFIRVDELNSAIISLDLSSAQAGILMTGKHQLCRLLTIETTEGSFIAEDIIDYDKSILNNGMKLTFRPEGLRFEGVLKDEAVFWVLPLTNFLCDLSEQCTALHHPLSIHPTQEIPPFLTDSDRKRLRRTLAGHSHVSNFTFNGQPAFVEMLPDYEERKHKLGNRDVPHQITAIMVGEIGSYKASYEDFDAWFPIDFIYLLGFATGRQIDAPWLEFRNQAGKLLRRIHFAAEQPCFLRQTRGFLPRYDRGEIGLLLTNYQESEYYLNSSLRVYVKHAIAASDNRLHLEERWAHVIQALDGLTKHFGFSKQDLLDGFTDGQKATIEEILRDAWTKIRAISVAPDNKDARNRIADKAQGSSQKDQDFGLAIIALLNKFRLNDAQVADSYLQIHPVSGNKNTFSQAISFLRGAILHEGALDVREGGEHDFDEAHHILFHMQDVLARVLLLMVGYKGKYVSLLAESSNDRRHLLWVTASTLPPHLGYGRDKW